MDDDVYILLHDQRLIGVYDTAATAAERAELDGGTTIEEWEVPGTLRAIRSHTDAGWSRESKTRRQRRPPEAGPTSAPPTPGREAATATKAAEVETTSSLVHWKQGWSDVYLVRSQRGTVLGVFLNAREAAEEAECWPHAGFEEWRLDGTRAATYSFGDDRWWREPPTTERSLTLDQ